MSTVNFYDVLDVSPDCSTKEIKTAYRELALIYHPDKPDGDAELFGLITDAYNILVNKNTRKEYDELYALSKQAESSHFDLKFKAKDFYTAIETDKKLKKKSKEDQKIDFDKVFEDMDRKHGYVRNADDKKEKFTDKKTDKLLFDLKMAREHDDIENVHEALFDKDRFDLEKFNEAFDNIHKAHNELIPHIGNPLAFNDDKTTGSAFSPINNYSDLYAEDDGLGTSEYGSVKIVQEPKKRIHKSDISKLKGAEYTKKHSYKDTDYQKSLDEKIKERSLLSSKLDDRSFNDFDDDPDCGGYGILHQITGATSSIDWRLDTDDDAKKKYQRLLELRKMQ